MDETGYNKHSSNQGLNCGKGQDDGTTYPIQNNEDNNGNCWIGRPLIVSGKNNATYYIKELSRTEGYELSVYGKDMVYTNRDAFENGGEVTAEGEVSIGTMTTVNLSDDDKGESYNDLTITGTDTVNGFDVTFKNLTQGVDIANFFTFTRELIKKEQEVTQLIPEELPLMATEGEPVLINGTRVEATMGEPDSNAPWVLVPKGGTDQESFNNMITTLTDYTGFHKMWIVEELDSAYVVQYSYTNAPDALYDITNQIVWVKKAVKVNGTEGYLYVKYDATALEHTARGFVINNQIPSKTEVTKYEDLTAITFTDSKRACNHKQLH